MSKIADESQKNGNGVKIEDVKEPGRQVKGILVSTDGINFLCTRELYTMILSTGELIDGKTYQGKTFILKKEVENEKELLVEGDDDEQPKGER